MTQLAYPCVEVGKPRQPSLSQEQLAAFARDGFLIVPSVFSASQIDKISRATHALAAIALGPPDYRRRFESSFVVSENSLGEARIERVVGAGATVPFLGEIGRSPQLTDMVSQLLESRQIVQLINQVHYKFPGDEVQFEWHQDSRHRRYGTHEWLDLNGRGSFVETITAIDPMTMDNGPIDVIPGSHLNGHLAVECDGKTLPRNRFELHDAMPVLLSPGDVLLLGPFTIHGSAPNHSAHSRRIFLNGFALPGANRRQYPWLGTGRNINC